MAFHPLVAPVLCSVATHLVCHSIPPNSLPAFGLVLFFPPAVLSYAYGGSLFPSLILYLISLAVSITTYRLSPFHPLAKYPGPALAKVSRLWAARQLLKGRQQELSHELFAQYGDVVRTGPNHLIIRDVRAVPIVLGPKNPWPKHDRYSVGLQYHSAGSLLALTEPGAHSIRRRIWDRAFTPSALKSYEPMLQNRVAILLAQLATRTGQPLDLADWFGFMTLDFMGDFAYGGLFDATATGADANGFHALAMAAMKSIEAAGALPWLRPLVIRMPSKANRFMVIADQVVRTRQAGGARVRDLFYYLLGEDGEGSHAPMSASTLAVEASLAIVAGSDTTGTALANTIFYLLTNPECFVRLRAEVDAAAGAGAAHDVDIETDKLVELKYMQAVINETLRLQPAVPNGVQRTPPRDGGPVVVAGHIVPVGTTVQIPTWSLHRDPRYFSPDPDAFWPERWLSDEGPKLAAARGQEFALNQGAYMPFNYGPGNCVGRALALHEMRTVLAAFLRRFDVRFAPDFAPEEWISRLRDWYILARSELKVVVDKRA